MKISVIIPIYNGEKTIRKCLNSIRNQTFKDYEIIIVDSSIDNTSKIIKEEFPEVKLTHLNKKTQPGPARNLGIKKAKSSIIALTDSDCIADKNWLKEIYKAHKTNDVVGGSVLNANPRNFISWASYLMEFTHVLPNKEKFIKHIPTCNISYKKEIFQKYGYFLDSWFPAEDRLFNYNLINNNIKLLFNPKIRISHINRTKIKEFLKHQIKLGNISAKCGKNFKNFDTSKFINNPLTLIFPLGKFITISLRILKNPKYIPIFILTLPIFSLGILIWGYAFIKEAYKND